MDLFVRYFVELPLPAAAVDGALDKIPAAWLVSMAGEAHVRAECLLVEAGIDLSAQRAGSVVELALALPVRLGSKTVRQLTWSVVGGGRMFPILHGDLEVGSLGHARAQLSVSGRYCPPADSLPLTADLATVHRVGEATVKAFLDHVASAIMVATRAAPIEPLWSAVTSR